jgi:hypothetical protein
VSQSGFAVVMFVLFLPLSFPDAVLRAAPPTASKP